LEASTKKLLKSAGARGQGVDSILRSQIDELSRAVSRNIGRLPLKLEKPQPKVMDLTTSSMEAYNYFIRGRNDMENLNVADAKRFLEKAVALDPTFAVAYLYLAQVSFYLVDTAGRDDALKKAMEFAGKATEKERLFIEAEYAQSIESDQAKERRLLLELTEKYPQEKHAHYKLGADYYADDRFSDAVVELEKAVSLDPDFGGALNMLGYSYAGMGDYRKAEAVFQRYISANPGDPNPVDSLAELYVHMGRFDLAEAKYKEAAGLKTDFTGSCVGLAYLYALQENYAESERWIREFLNRATDTARMEGLYIQYFLDYLQGRLEKAQAGFQSLRQIGEASRSDFIMQAADHTLGYLSCELGWFDRTRSVFESRLAEIAAESWNETSKKLHGARYTLRLGWIDLKQGRLEAARRRAAEAERLMSGCETETLFPRVKLILQILRAELALAENDPRTALAEAAKFVLWNFPGMNTVDSVPYNMPFQIDVAARAHWKLGELDKAAAKYKRLMTVNEDNRYRRLIHPLYHYRLGRVLEEKGDKPGAVVEYRKFLEYWKDADKTHPEPADARKRLAALAAG
ncbi:MAG: tetratricopeptide repeat protein, partial [Candidatus Aminicenantes bacterium]|nr:tetratricopeptide repeat protein [Candidatus Aminicenantes bacterium]